MTFDSRTEANLATLTPKTQAAARAFLQSILDQKPFGEEAYTVKVISGTRSYDQQNDLFHQGRKWNDDSQRWVVVAPHEVVTNAPAGYSNHNFGIAFDLGIFDPQGRYIDDLPGKDPNWTERLVSVHYRVLAALGEAQGLTWGGAWKTICDEPHYELHPWPGLSEDETLAKLRSMHANGEAIA